MYLSSRPQSEKVKEALRLSISATNPVATCDCEKIDVGINKAKPTNPTKYRPALTIGSVYDTPPELEPERKMKLALCQICVVAGDREGNFQRIGVALREATDQDATLAVLPESCLLGWVNPDAHRLAHSIPGPDSDRLCAMARDLGIGLVAGLEEKNGANLHGSAVAISADGELLALHRKINVLPELMDPPYTPGHADQLTLAQFPWGTVALLICADTFNNSATNRVKSAEPDLLVVPYGWAAVPHEWPEHADRMSILVCRRAKEIGCPVIGVDCVGEIVAGPWKGKTFGGASVASDADGRRLTAPRIGEDCVIIAEIEIG
jgi:N-carbamoylputrescine amidase